MVVCALAKWARVPRGGMIWGFSFVPSQSRLHYWNWQDFWGERERERIGLYDGEWMGLMTMIAR